MFLSGVQQHECEGGQVKLLSRNANGRLSFPLRGLIDNFDSTQFIPHYPLQTTCLLFLLGARRVISIGEVHGLSSSGGALEAGRGGETVERPKASILGVVQGKKS